MCLGGATPTVVKNTKLDLAHKFRINDVWILTLGNRFAIRAYRGTQAPLSVVYAKESCNIAR